MFNTSEKKERALGVKLFLKADRCQSPKCATVRRPTRPGMHGRRRRNISEYGTLLQEKQRFQYSYGLRESQMKRLFKEAVQSKIATGEAFLSLLERRLDNVVYRLGLVRSRSIGRQLVGHGHITVNNKKLTASSYRVRAGDTIGVRSSSSELAEFKQTQDASHKHDVPTWLSFKPDTVTGVVEHLPTEFDTEFDVNLVVDYYSK
jgi:small subunit ribosomal protein S4